YVFSRPNPNVDAVQNCSIGIRISKSDIVEHDSIAKSCRDCFRPGWIRDFWFERQEVMNIGKEEIVFIQLGNASEKLTEGSLSLLDCLIKHDQVSDAHETLESAVCKKAIQAENGNNSCRLGEQVSN